MLKNREQLYQTYHSMLSMALTWALVLVINQYFTLKVPIVLSAVFSIAVSVFIYFFDQYKKNVISYILLLSIFPLLALIFWIKRINPIVCIQDYYSWCMTYNGSEELYRTVFAWFTVFGVALLGVVVFYVLTKTRTARLVLAIANLAAILLLCISEINVNKAVVGISVFYIMTIVVEWCGFVYNRKDGRQEKREGILYLAPICLLLAILAISIPSKAEPVKWTFVKNTYKSIKEQIEIWQTDIEYYFGNGKSEFFLSLSGYSDDSGSLDNDEISLDDRLAMKLTGLSRDDSVYLTGSVSDIYTGYSWEKSRKDYVANEEDYLLDYSELFYFLTRQDHEALVNNKLVRKDAIEITYNNIKTKTFFYPLKTSSYDFNSSYRKLKNEAAQITFKHARGKGTSYKSIYYEMNLENEVFRDMLRKADSFTYDSAPAINLTEADWLQSELFNRDNVNTPLRRPDIYQILGERASIIKQRNTVLPEGLPERVKQLARDLTTDYDSSYDKLKAIEAYLNEYTYTLKPKKAPEGQDFTDYFLFESKEGYCTSFATAMAVLGRCIGIPTRYVEGFIVKGGDKTSDGYCAVKNSQAHAWAEAYIEGFGWIPFEATAPFFNNRYTEWPEIDPNATSSQVVYDPSQYYQNQQQMQDIVKMINTAKKDKKPSYEVINIIVIFFAVLGGLLLVLVIYYFIARYRYNKYFKRSDNGSRMYLLFLRILRLLKREGFALEQQETIWMLSMRVKDNFQYNGATFKEVADIYMRYRYAEREITKEQLDQVRCFHIGMAGKCKEEENWLLMWLDEYVFLIQTNRRWKHRYNNT